MPFPKWVPKSSNLELNGTLGTQIHVLVVRLSHMVKLSLLSKSQKLALLTDIRHGNFHINMSIINSGQINILIDDSVVNS